MGKYFISFGLFLGTSSHNLFGQDITPIQLDRPDQTECPFITPTKYIQIENGLTHEYIGNKKVNFSYPSTLWKYGVNKKFELRLITELATEKDETKSTTGFLPLTFGFKTNICKEKGIIPMTSFIGHITTSKIGSKEFHTKYIAPSFRFTMQHTVTDKISIAYNLGAEWDAETVEQTYIYTLTTGISLTDKLGGYIEVYGFVTKDNKADHRFDCGLTYLINNDFMMDLSGGFGLTDNAPENYLSLGLSYRFITINK